MMMLHSIKSFMIFLLILLLHGVVFGLPEYKHKMTWHEITIGTSNAIQRRTNRAVTSSADKLWPAATIPYTIDETLEDWTVSYILEAIDHWQNNTCLKFVQQNTETDHVLFTKEDCGCCSSVGRIGGLQTVSLSERCATLAVAIHEIGHVIGYWHEHTRPDRDKYIKIVWNNIAEDKYINFEKRLSSEINSLGRPYDVKSIMHYGPKTFTKNRKDSMLSANGLRIQKPLVLSSEDILQTILLYNCPAQSCHRTVKGYGTGKVTSPYYPHIYLPNLNCTWLVEVPKDAFVKLKFESFSLQDSYHCTADILEIRQQNSKGRLIGEFCGEGYPPDITSTVSIWIGLRSDWRLQKKGFSIYYEISKLVDRVKLKLNSNSDYPVAVEDKECVRITRKLKGTYESPKIPTGKLAEMLQCSLTIDGGEQAKRVFLKFNTDQAQAFGENCVGDIYKFNDSSSIVGMFEASGDDESRSLNDKSWQRIVYLCDFLREKELLVETSRVILVWASSRHKPMQLEYTIDYNECELGMHTCDHICHNTVDGYICSCEPGFLLYEQTFCIPKITPFRDRCGETFTEVSGKILSSTEPATTCRYHIELPGYKIHLRFTKIRLHAENNCSSNYIEVTNKKASLVKICRDDDISTLVIANHISISRYMNPNRWRIPYFVAEYSAIRKQQEKCFHTMEGTGNFSSPGFPHQYPADILCVWKLSTRQGQRIVLKFTFMELELTKGCAFDYVSIHDGRTRRSPVLATLCGVTQHNLLSTGKHLTVVFVADRSGQAKGFIASFSSVNS